MDDDPRLNIEYLEEQHIIAVKDVRNLIEKNAPDVHKYSQTCIQVCVRARSCTNLCSVPIPFWRGVVISCDDALVQVLDFELLVIRFLLGNKWDVGKVLLCMFTPVSQIVRVPHQMFHLCQTVSLLGGTTCSGYV